MITMTTCCNMPKYESNSGTRCSGCGHRQTVAGVAPKQTRDIMKRKPQFLFTELKGRHDAKAHGRLLNATQF